MNLGINILWNIWFLGQVSSNMNQTIQSLAKHTIFKIITYNSSIQQILYILYKLC